MKLCIIAVLVLLTIILYLLKNKISINWEMMATILGFVGVIITIRETEKSRIKQNRFEYQKEKINDEQIEFKKMIKEKINFLDFRDRIIHYYSISEENYYNEFLKLNTYRMQIGQIINDIYWYYDEKPFKDNKELEKFIKQMLELIIKYDDKLSKLGKVILKFKNGKAKEIIDEEFKVLEDIRVFCNKNIDYLSAQAKKVIEERDKLVSCKVIEKI